MILSWFERTNSHNGTERRSILLWRQQWRIFDNERKFDRVRPCGWM